MINRLTPPALMTELNRIPISGIQLAGNALQARRCVAVAGRELKEKTAHLRSQNFFDRTEFLDQHAGSNQPFLMRDQTIHLYRIAKILRRISAPALHGTQLGPFIERRVQLDGLERRSVMLEPCVGPLRIGIKNSAPMPIKPAGATDVDLHIAP